MRRTNIYAVEDCGDDGSISAAQNNIIETKSAELNYQPRIGVMGKTGAGKSSLCNALFGQDVCEISDIEGCTRNPQDVLLNISHGKSIILVDVPGIGENSRRDQEYADLYKSLLPELDAIFWIRKADDRAYQADEVFFNNLIRPYINDGNPLFIVINQVDKIDPIREWNRKENSPGPNQMANIRKRIDDISGFFDIAASRIIPVSAYEKYNLVTLITELFFALPAKKKSSVIINAKNFDYDAAIKKYELAIKKYNDVDAMYKLGELYYYADKPHQNLNKSEYYLKQGEQHDDLRCMCLLTEMYLDTSHFTYYNPNNSVMIDLLNLSEDTKSPMYNPEAGQKMLSKIEQIALDTSNDALLEIVADFYIDEKYGIVNAAKAEQYYRSLESKDPDDIELKVKLAMCLEAQGSVKQAVDIYKSLAQADSPVELAVRRLIYYYSKTGDDANKAKWIDYLFENFGCGDDEETEKWLLFNGRYYHTQFINDNDDDSIKACLKAYYTAAQKFDNVGAYFELGVIWSTTLYDKQEALENYQKCLELYKKEREKMPSDPWIKAQIEDVTDHISMCKQLMR